MKSIETWPPLALSAVSLNLSRPAGSACRLSVSPTGFGADVDGFRFAGLDALGATGLARFGLEDPARGVEALGVRDVAVLDVVVAFVDLLGVVGRRLGIGAGLLGAGAAVVVVDVVGVTAAPAGVDREVVVPLDEPPQPATASRPTIEASVESLLAGWGFARRAVWEGIGPIFSVAVAGRRAGRAGSARRWCHRADAAGRSQDMPGAAEAVDAFAVGVALGVVA